MRRWFSIFLLIVLPLQFSWAAAAAYCELEAAQTAPHPGHHEHTGDLADLAAEQGTKADSSTDGESKVPAADECSYCHLGCAKTIGAAPLAFSACPESRFASLTVLSADSPLPDRIDRPDWFRVG